MSTFAVFLLAIAVFAVALMLAPWAVNECDKFKDKE